MALSLAAGDYANAPQPGSDPIRPAGKRLGMPWTERRLTDRVGIELSGERIGPGLSPADRMAVRAATERHGVTVIRDQQLSDEDLYDFVASLGDKIVEV